MKKLRNDKRRVNMMTAIKAVSVRVFGFQKIISKVRRCSRVPSCSLCSQGDGEVAARSRRRAELVSFNGRV